MQTRYARKPVLLGIASAELLCGIPFGKLTEWALYFGSDTDRQTEYSFHSHMGRGKKCGAIESFRCSQPPPRPPPCSRWSASAGCCNPVNHRGRGRNETYQTVDYMRPSGAEGREGRGPGRGTQSGRRGTRTVWWPTAAAAVWGWGPGRRP